MGYYENKASSSLKLATHMLLHYDLPGESCAKGSARGRVRENRKEKWENEFKSEQSIAIDGQLVVIT